MASKTLSPTFVFIWLPAVMGSTKVVDRSIEAMPSSPAANSFAATGLDSVDQSSRTEVLSHTLSELLDAGAEVDRQALEDVTWAALNLTTGCSSLREACSYTPREIESTVDNPLERRLAANAFVGLAVLEPLHASRCCARALFLDETNVAASLIYITGAAEVNPPSLSPDSLRSQGEEHSRSAWSRWKLGDRALERLLDDRLDMPLDEIIANCSEGIYQLLPAPEAYLSAGVTLSMHRGALCDAQGQAELADLHFKTAGVCGHLLLQELALPADDLLSLDRLINADVEQLHLVWSDTDRGQLIKALEGYAIGEERYSGRPAVALKLTELAELVSGEAATASERVVELKQQLFERQVNALGGIAEEGSSPIRPKLEALIDVVRAKQEQGDVSGAVLNARDVIKLAGIESLARIKRESGEHLVASLKQSERGLVAEAITALAYPHTGLETERTGGVALLETALHLDKNNQKANLLLLEVVARQIREGRDVAGINATDDGSKRSSHGWMVVNGSVERLLQGDLGDPLAAIAGNGKGPDAKARAEWSCRLTDAAWICERSSSLNSRGNAAEVMEKIADSLLDLYGLKRGNRDNLGVVLKTLGKTDDEPLDADVQLHAARGYYTLGRAHELRNQHAVAETHYQLSLKINPGQELATDALKRVRGGAAFEKLTTAGISSETLRAQELFSGELPRVVLDAIKPIRGGLRRIVREVAEECCGHVAALTVEPRRAAPAFSEALREKIDSWWALVDPDDITPQAYIDYLGQIELLRKVRSGEFGANIGINGDLEAQLGLLQEHVFGNYALDRTENTEGLVISAFKAINSRVLRHS